MGVVFALAGFGGAYRHAGKKAMPILYRFSGMAAVPVSGPPADGSQSMPSKRKNTAGGLVTDSAGTPLAGVEVRFFRPGEDAPAFVARSDAQGRFEMPSAAPPGGFWVVMPVRDGYFGSQTLWAHAESDPVLRMQAAAGLNVEVIDAAGKPASGARVRIAGVDVAPPGEWTAGNDGRVRIENLPPGVLAIEAVLENQVAQMEGAEIEPGQNAYVHLYLEEGIVIKGLVRDDKDDRPVSGALFTIAREDPSLLTHAVVSGEDGRFVIGPLPEGNYRFSLAAAGYVPLAARRFWVGRETGLALFEMTRGIAITGRVLDMAGRPVAKARVDAWGMDAAGQWIAPVALTAPVLPGAGQLGVVPRTFEMARASGDSALTDEKGEYRLSGVSPGYLWLSVSHDDFVSAGRVLGEIVEDHEAPDIRLAEGGEVTLVVRDERDFAVSGAMVRMESAFGMEEGRTFITDDRGEVRITGVGQNAYISVFHPDFPVHVEKLGSARIQRVRLEHGTRAFVFRLRDGRRMPVVLAQVEILARSRPERRAVFTDENGMARIDGLAGGVYDVTVTHPNYPEWKQSGLEPGEYDWFLPYGGGFSAFVRDVQTLEGLSARILLFSGDGMRLEQGTNKGEALFLALRAGSWTVRVESPGYVPLQTEVTVQDAAALMENNGAPQLWEMRRAGSVSGVVRDEAGFVVRGAVVVAGGETGVSDRNGRFFIQGLPPGEIDVAAWHVRKGMGSERVHVMADLESPEVIVDLRPWPASGKPGGLGVQLEQDRAASVLRVKSVLPGSPAARAGLKPGDAVWRIDGLSAALPLFFLETRLQRTAGTGTLWMVGSEEDLAVPVFLRFE